MGEIMAYPLPESAREWQAKARAFADEDLIPWEVHAEMNNGELPPEVRQRHAERALALRLPEVDVPKERGGLGLSMLEQVVIAEQLGRVTKALAWCYSLPQTWMFAACNEDQIERFVMPLADGSRHDCYAITEADAGSDVDAIAATARRDGDDYLVDGEK